MSLQPISKPSSPFLPLESGLSHSLLSLKEAFNTLSNFRYLKAENERLKVLLAEFNSQSRIMKEIILENKRLYDLLEYKDTLDYKTLSCQIIGWEPGNWFQAVTIDKGFKDGIRKNSPVVGCQQEKKGLVGRVIEVKPSSSKVLLLTDKNSKIGVKLAKSQLKGVLEGENKPLCGLSYIPLEAEVQVGEMVLTVGGESLFPAKIPVGQVVEVERREKDLFSKIKVSPFIKFSQLEEVLVIVEKREHESHELTNITNEEESKGQEN